MAVGIPAEGPLDDATNKNVIKLLRRKPTAIKERPGDRRREIGYIEIRAQLAARLGPRRNRIERCGEAAASAASQRLAKRNRCSPVVGKILGRSAA